MAFRYVPLGNFITEDPYADFITEEVSYDSMKPGEWYRDNDCVFILQTSKDGLSNQHVIKVPKPYGWMRLPPSLEQERQAILKSIHLHLHKRQLALD